MLGDLEGGLVVRGFRWRGRPCSILRILAPRGGCIVLYTASVTILVLEPPPLSALPRNSVCLQALRLGSRQLRIAIRCRRH